uniref:Nuclear pore complex protein Nup85 n=1 Tax=Amphora coffeiformis TaxID=265554 RepID=A0A7S3P7Y7_9STRA|eukprot:scaffold425_cov175-Amphora_coffeaeformis.AAC.8
MTEEATSRPNPVVWDPTCPARVLMLSDRSVAIASPKKQQQPINFLWSHTGASSCNKHEISALIKIIQANEFYQERLDREATPSAPSKIFSRQCREALRDCLLRWMEEVQQDAEKTEQEKELHEQSMENLELLRITYCAMMLSDVFLPLLPTTSLTTDYREDPFGMPGAASANFIRYLRSCHMEDAELMDEGIVQMLDSTHPDQHGDGSLYWRYVETLVLRGLLEEAWKMLERHSQFQTAVAFTQSTLNNDPGFVESMEIVHDDFLIIREVLLRAPLPGGRNDINDDTLGASQMEDDEMSTEYYLNGLDVGPSDYNFWQTDTSVGDEMGDYPWVFSPEPAIRKHEKWQNFVKRQVRPNLRVTRRIPELEIILAILCGDFSQVRFVAWPEKLCADILYSRPQIRPRDVNKLTSSVMKEFNAHEEPFADAIVNIMKGNAGMAISTFYTLGAGSGAALPTTLLSVLYDMFLKASIVQPEAATHKTEFLTEAAFAIVSSLASKDSDVGIELATRLLMPYTLQEDVSSEVTAYLTEILEHYNPNSDASAKNILNRCETLMLRTKNRRVVECCASIVLCRYRFHCNQNQPGLAVAWLFRGIRMETMMVDKVEDGSCYKKLAGLCYSTAGDVLKAMNNAEKLDGDVSLTEQQMASEIERADLSSSDGNIKIRELVPVISFMQAHAMFEATMIGDRITLAKCIVTCVSKGSHEKSGLPSTFMPLSLLAVVLEIACKLILNDFEAAERAGGTPITSLFDRQSMSALMESLSLLESYSDLSMGVSKTKEILLRGLAQAIIAENAMKRVIRDNRGGFKSPGSANLNAIYTMSLSKHTQNTQEAVIQKMLDF